MRFVVDSSIAIKWFTIEVDHEKAKAVIGEALIAPDLLMAEVSNGIWKKVRSGEIGGEQAALAQSMVSSFVELAPALPLAVDALAIAIELGHPVYDCFFLALSAASGVPLLTADRRLLRRCESTGFSELTRAL